MNQKKQKDLLLLLAAVLCAAALAVMTAVLAFGAGKGSGQTDFTPPPFDPSAVQGPPDVPDGLGWEELDAQAFQVSVCGAVILDGDTADIWLTNPAENTVWLKLRVLDAQGDTLGETGLIRPGEYVQSVALDALPEDGDAVTLKLMAYEPETYYSEGSVSLKTTVTMGGGK